MRYFIASALIGTLIFVAFGGKPERRPIAPPPPVITTGAVALEMCGRMEFVVVVKSNGDSTLVLDPSREVIELLDKVIQDPKRKQVVHMRCPMKGVI